MAEISLVTAFYNIGRENFKAIPRTDDTYMANFKFWCRMKNRLIVYTDSYHGEKILDIRAQFGLRDRTVIVTIDNLTEIEPAILERMKGIQSDGWFEQFRVLPNATSNIPEYSYLMLLKTWFLYDAVRKGYVNGTVAWIDFGFNHGGELFTNPEEFDFSWNYNFSDKIHMFYYKALDEKPTYEIVRRLCDCFMGCLYVLPERYCERLWNLTKEAMNTLNDMGLYDDDQLLLLMAYRKEPELFELHESEWFLPLKEYGGEHLTVRTREEIAGVKRFYNRFFRSLHKHRLAARNALLTYRNLILKD